MTASAVGPHLHAFFVDYLSTQKGLRVTSIRSYRDTLRLFLAFIAGDAHRALTKLTPDDLTFDRVLEFLKHLEVQRGNSAHTRNQRLAALHTFFGYLAERIPEMLDVGQGVALISTKRAALPETRYLERDEIATLFDQLPTRGRRALRDRVLLLVLYNSGARAQEIADLGVEHLDLRDPPRVRLHGRGDKWRTCPLWADTARELTRLLASDGTASSPQAPVFRASGRGPLTRFGIYKLVRRHVRCLEAGPHHSAGRITPHVFRHTTAVHLLESGIEMNVIRGWLGHANVTTTNRYAEITVRSKAAAVRACEAPSEFSVALGAGGSGRTTLRFLPGSLRCERSARSAGDSSHRSTGFADN
jgi:site-specific recombinase XerD